MGNGQVIHHSRRAALTDEDVAARAGTFMGPDDYDTIIDYDANVVDRDTGETVLKYREKVLPAEAVRVARGALQKAAGGTDNRGTAAGRVKDHETVGERDAVKDGATRLAVMKTDGTVSNTGYAKQVLSGIIGYFDRYPRFPYCRQTAYTENELQHWREVQPLIRAVDSEFRRLIPERWAAQMDFIGRTNPDFVIRGTSFTTLTVNRNWQTALHTDRGDLPEGFGVLTCLRSGEYEGGFLVMPKYRVAVDMTSGCVLCMNVHEWHGNSTIRHGAKWERITCVFYARKKMIFCGSAADELERAKRRQPGDPLATDDLNSINADPAGT